MGIPQEFREFQNGGRNFKAKGYMHTIAYLQGLFTYHPVGKGGVGFHIPKIAINPMLIYFNERLKTIHDTPLEQEGVYRIH